MQLLLENTQQRLRHSRQLLAERAKKKRLVTHVSLNLWHVHFMSSIQVIQVKVQTIHNAFEEQFQADER